MSKTEGTDDQTFLANSSAEISETYKDKWVEEEHEEETDVEQAPNPQELVDAFDATTSTPKIVSGGLPDPILTKN